MRKVMVLGCLWCLLALAACEQPGGAPSPVLEANANLSLLELSAGNLSPAFSPETTGYTAVVPNNVESVSVTAQAASAAAAVDNPAKSGRALSVGENPSINIGVRAENGATKTYTLTITRLDGQTKLIASAADLAKIGVADGWPLAGKYILDADLTLADWTPVGGSLWNSVDTPLDGSSTPFSGSFDGQGHTITLQSLAPASYAVDKSYLGIFSGIKGAPEHKASVKNLRIVSQVDITSSPASSGQAIGLVAGYTENAEISGVTLSGAFKFTSAAKNVYAGGLVGYAQKGTVIKDCESGMNVTLTGGAGGGFVASSFYNFAGGFVGIFKDGVEITNCRMTGNVTGLGSAAESQIFTGGIAGGSYYAFTTESQGSISYCSNTGDVYAAVDGFWAWTGGITGVVCGDGGGGFEETTKVYRCWASGAVTSVAKAGQWPYTGGIAGYIYYGGLAAECYFTGTVTSMGKDGGEVNDYTGGIAGYLSKETGHNSALRDCWSAGTVNGRVNAGGIAGQHQVASKLYNCYSRSTVTVSAGAGKKGSYSQQGAGGIAGFCASGGGGDYAGGFAPASLYSCVALNPSISAPNGFERLGRVIGDSTGAVEHTFGWRGMSVTAGGGPARPFELRNAQDEVTNFSVDGEDCEEKPPQALYEGLGWDFVKVWKMGADGYPALRWQE
ncbi:MAG: cadherin-like beta sandwich domain-containing protein [Treponema sp.]|jgi:hypothetical protein|nr:cadherin-like beta sandwich domain-containing protein [Treponema sp.]